MLTFEQKLEREIELQENEYQDARDEVLWDHARPEGWTRPLVSEKRAEMMRVIGFATPDDDIDHAVHVWYCHLDYSLEEYEERLKPGYRVNALAELREMLRGVDHDLP